MKKSVIILGFILFTSIFITTACAKEETNKEFKSLAENKTVSADLPKGVKVVENPEEYQPVTQDQAYNPETDTHYNLRVDTAADNKNIYILQEDMVHVLDKETKSYIYLCNKPDCKHSYPVEECNAHVGLGALCYYNGDLYTIGTEYEAEGNVLISEKQVLYKTSTAGAGKEKVCELATIYNSDMVELAGGEGINHDIYWVIHRGYIYYAYRIGTSGLKDDSFYNNNSNYVMRKKIDGSGGVEYLMPLQGESLEQITFRGCGSYVYFYDIKSDDKSIYYRFNTESQEIEKLPFENVTIEVYEPTEDGIYYTKGTAGKDRDTGLYKYYFKENRTEKIFDFADYNENYGIIYPIYLMKDEEHIYGYSCVDEKGEKTNCMVLDYDGNYISDFDIAVNGNYRAGLRLDSELVLLPINFQEGWYWFDKKELETGQISPKLIEGTKTEEK